MAHAGQGGLRIIVVVQSVLTIYDRNRPGSHCRRLYMAVSALLDAGYAVHYLAAERLDVAEHPNLHPHILRLPCRTNQGIWFWLCFSVVAPIAFARLAWSVRPRALLVFDPLYALIAKFAAQLTATPLVLFLRAVPWRVNLLDHRPFVVRTYLSLRDKLGLRSSRVVVALTRAMVQELLSRDPDLEHKLTLLPNAVIPSATTAFSRGEFSIRKSSVAERFNIPEKDLLLITTGELIRRRNVEYLVRAIGATSNERVSLIICGDGPESQKLSALIVGLGLVDRVVLAGWVDDPVSIVAGCDLFVLPSRHEGMSNSLLEAMGVGVPAIAADTPEMREVLAYEQLLFTPAHVGQLAARIDTLAGSRQELDNITRLCAERAKKFSFNWGLDVVKLVEGL